MHPWSREQRTCPLPPYRKLQHRTLSLRDPKTIGICGRLGCSFECPQQDRKERSCHSRAIFATHLRGLVQQSFAAGAAMVGGSTTDPLAICGHSGQHVRLMARHGSFLCLELHKFVIGTCCCHQGMLVMIWAMLKHVSKQSFRQGSMCVCVSQVVLNSLSLYLHLTLVLLL